MQGKIDASMIKNYEVFKFMETQEKKQNNNDNNKYIEKPMSINIDDYYEIRVSEEYDSKEVDENIVDEYEYEHTYNYKYAYNDESKTDDSKTDVSDSTFIDLICSEDNENTKEEKKNAK